MKDTHHTTSAKDTPPERSPTNIFRDNPEDWFQPILDKFLAHRNEPMGWQPVRNRFANPLYGRANKNDSRATACKRMPSKTITPETLNCNYPATHTPRLPKKTCKLSKAMIYAQVQHDAGWGGGGGSPNKTQIRAYSWLNRAYLCSLPLPALPRSPRDNMFQQQIMRSEGNLFHLEACGHSDTTGEHVPPDSSTGPFRKGSIIRSGRNPRREDTTTWGLINRPFGPQF